MTARLCTKLLLSCAATSAALAAAATPTVTDVDWQAYNGDYSGLFTDKNHWTSGAVPDALQNARFNISHTQCGKGYTVTLPDGDFDTKAGFEFRVYSGQDCALNWTNAVWKQVATQDENYPPRPFQIRYSSADSRLFVLETPSSAASTDRFTKSPTTISNAYVRMNVRDGGNTYNIHFDKGIYNFYDSDGATWAGAAKGNMYIADLKGGKEFVTVHSNAHMRLPNLRLAANCFTNSFDFAGGTHEIMGQLQLAVTLCRGLDTLFRVGDGADVSIGSGIKFGYTGDSGNTGAQKMRVLVEGGSRLDVDGGFAFGGPGLMPIDVLGGSTLALSGGTVFRIGGVIARM